MLDGQQPVADEGSLELARQLGIPAGAPRRPGTRSAGTGDRCGRDPGWPVTRGGPGALVLDGRQPVAVRGAPELACQLGSMAGGLRRPQRPGAQMGSSRWQVRGALSARQLGSMA